MNSHVTKICLAAVFSGAVGTAWAQEPHRSSAEGMAPVVNQGTNDPSARQAFPTQPGVAYGVGEEKSTMTGGQAGGNPNKN